MSDNVFKQILDRFIRAAQEKAILEKKLNDIKKQLQPQNVVVKISNEMFFLN